MYYISLIRDNIKKIKFTLRFDIQLSKKFISLISKLMPLCEEENILTANLSDLYIFNNLIAYSLCPSMSELIKKKIK